MKKSFNWAGSILIFFYALILFTLIGGSLWLAEARTIFYVLIVFWIAAMLCLIPITIIKTFKKGLPEIQSEAKIVSKGIKNDTLHVDGIPYSYTDFIISFELINGVTKAMKIPQNKYDTLLEGDFGILTYKEKGKLCYFIDFQN